MTVLEAGQQHAALKVDHAAVVANKLLRAGIVADIDDFAILYGDRLGGASIGIDGVDKAVREERIGTAYRLIAGFATTTCGQDSDQTQASNMQILHSVFTFLGEFFN
jgi:hypothetical protein